MSSVKTNRKYQRLLLPLSTRKIFWTYQRLVRVAPKNRVELCHGPWGHINSLILVVGPSICYAWNMCISCNCIRGRSPKYPVERRNELKVYVKACNLVFYHDDLKTVASKLMGCHPFTLGPKCNLILTRCCYNY